VIRGAFDDQVSSGLSFPAFSGLQAGATYRGYDRAVDPPKVKGAAINAAHRLIAIFLLLLGACSTGPAGEGSWKAVSPASAQQPAQQDPKQGWWADHRWRYATDEAAEVAYQALLTRESPWPEWHQSNLVTLPAGLRFEMALAPGQGTDRPGGFGTFDRIADVRFVRYSLAVKNAWKPQVDRVVTYEIVDPLPADTGIVGPQIDVPANLYLPGGASQFEMKVPATERAGHLKVIAVRPIE
jgi:hypothetical protein